MSKSKKPKRFTRNPVEVSLNASGKPRVSHMGNRRALERKTRARRKPKGETADEE